MPTQTFWNLPEEKRRAVVELAVEEFAENDYHSASVSRIVARAGIAKGSVYQYFENKQELFLYLVDYAVEQQLRLLKELAPPDGEAGFFAQLRWQMSASARVGAAAPLLVRLVARAVADDHPLREVTARRLQAAGTGHIREMVERGMARGEVDSSLDPELVAAMVKSLTGDLGSLIARRLGLSLEDVAADSGRLAGAEAERIFDEAIRVLRHGLAAPA